MFKGGKPAWHENHERKGREESVQERKNNNTNDGDLIFYTAGTLLASFYALPTGGDGVAVPISL